MHPLPLDLQAPAEAHHNSQENKEWGDVNEIHYQGGIFQRGGKAIRTYFYRAKRPEMSKP